MRGDLEGRERTIRTYTVDEAVSTIVESDKKDIPRRASHSTEMDGWAGASWEQSLELMTRGWLNGVPKVDTLARTRLAESLRPKPVWDVAGSECDVAAYLAGVPECMGEIVRRHRPVPVVSIGVDRCASAGVDRSKIERVGRNVLVLVESLRLSGAAAEVWVCQGIAGGGGIFDLRVRIQEAGRPIDVSRMAYWVAHPAALRKSMFALEETEKTEVRDKFGFYDGRGYGMPYQDVAKDDFDEWAPGVHASQEELTAWVKDVMTRRVGGKR